MLKTPKSYAQAVQRLRSAASATEDARGSALSVPS